MSFAVNHLAPFLLTHLLLDLVKKSAPARIVNVSSTVHYGASLKFDNLQGERKYNGVEACKVAKLGNVLFTYELADRLKANDVKLRRQLSDISMQLVGMKEDQSGVAVRRPPTGLEDGGGCR